MLSNHNYAAYTHFLWSPWPIILSAHARANGLNEQTHWFAFYSRVAFHAQYILRAGSKDLGATTLEGSRNGMAMMVYSALHIFGRKGYELLIDRSIDKAKDFAQMIDKAQDFELTTTPILSLLTYRVCPAEVQEKLKHVNAKTRNAINEKVDVKALRLIVHKVVHHTQYLTF